MRSALIAGRRSPYSDSSTSSATARMRVDLHPLKAQRGPCLVDGYERHRLVTLDRRDLAEHVAPHPPRGRREIGCPDRLAALGIGDPEQACAPDGVDGCRAQASELVRVVDEEHDHVVFA